MINKSVAIEPTEKWLGDYLSKDSLIELGIKDYIPEEKDVSTSILKTLEGDFVIKRQKAIKKEYEEVISDNE